MTAKTFKKRICEELTEAAKQYKAVYIDYEYLICSEAFVQRGYYIIAAKEDNFQHLTGVHSFVLPKVFFEKCYTGALTENDFDFIKRGQDEKAVKGTVRRKIKVLPNMMNLFCDGVMTEEQFVKNKVFCSFAAADEGCTLGFSGSEKAARPKSLIKGNELSNPKPADLILRRKTGMTQFDEILLGDEQALSKYRSQIHSMLAENLLIAGSVF